MATRRNALLLMVEPQLISSGLLPDRHPLSQPLWEAAVNVRFVQGKVRRRLPASSLFVHAPGRHHRGLSQHQDSTGTRWVWSALQEASGANAGQLVIGRWYGPAAENLVTTAAVNIDETSQLPAPLVDFTHWGNWTIWNWGRGEARLYKPDTGHALLAGAPTDVVRFMKKRNQLMAIGYGLTKKLVGWSHADNINLWAAAQDNIAGELPIEELDTGIRAAARLGDYIACYAEDQMALVYWTGAPFYYGQRVALDGIGATGKGAVCVDGRFNYGVSRNGIWRTDGNEYRYIDEGALNEYLQANVNWAQASKIIAFRNDVARSIEFFFPMGANLEVSEGWSYDPATSSWTPVPSSQAAAERVLFNKPLFGRSGTVYLAEDNPAGAGPLTLRTKPLLMLGEDRQPLLHTGSLVDEIEFLLKAASNIEFRYGVAEKIDGVYEWTDWQALHTDQRTYTTGKRVTGTYHVLEFRNTAANWDLDLQGFALFGQSEGIKRAQV